MVTGMDLRLSEKLSDLGLVTSAKDLLSMPRLHLTVTISFVGIPLVDLNVSLTREIISLKKMTEPFGDLIQTVLRQGFGGDNGV
jgi:hypothetical protein